ncbi:MAG: Gfo/Idh/MocA family oxidoreductase [Thermoanaerobaculia bacterium]
MRFAILGCGSIGRRHARNLVTLGERDLIIYDRYAPAGEALASELGVRSCTVLDEVWSRDPEVAFVTAPTSDHIELALTAARNGCHLFVEKPLSHSREGVEALAAEVGLRGLVAMVACNMRFHPGPARIKRLVETNGLGQILAAKLHAGSHLPGWRPGTNYRDSYSASASRGGGAVLDCIHEIDLALWYFGPGRVVGAATRPAASIGLDVEGIAEMLLIHGSGVVSNIHLNFVQRDYRRTCQIVGAEASLYWDFENPYIQICRGDGHPPEVEMLPGEWATNDMYVDELRYFLCCIREGRGSLNDIGAARETLEVALHAKELGGMDPAGSS